MSWKLYRHVFLERPDLPPMPGPLVYVIAGNGVHLWGKREGLEALIPVTACSIRDLHPVEPFVRIDVPLLDAATLAALLAVAREARTEDGTPLEALFYPHYEPRQAWQLIIPPQERSLTRVRPLEDGMQAYTQAWWEIHSHHHMSAFFSGTDDMDEQGFRIYGVVGRIFRRPEIRLRVGIYGHFWEFPARFVCTLPDGVMDAVEQAGDHESEVSDASIRAES
jgi:PRTRC genetic system protein A